VLLIAGKRSDIRISQPSDWNQVDLCQKKSGLWKKHIFCWNWVEQSTAKKIELFKIDGLPVCPVNNVMNLKIFSTKKITKICVFTPNTANNNCLKIPLHCKKNNNFAPKIGENSDNYIDPRQILTFFVRFWRRTRWPLYHATRATSQSLYLWPRLIHITICNTGVVRSRQDNFHKVEEYILVLGCIKLLLSHKFLQR
jgi:hypothetical protein